MLTTQYQALGTGYPLSSFFGYQTKEQLQKMADSIDIYLPHSHRKERQAEELAAAIVDDQYSTRLGFNSMIGFIVKPLDVDATCGDINTHLVADEQLMAVARTTTSGCFDFESSINTQSGSITLLHLWMDFSSMLEPISSL